MHTELGHIATLIQEAEDEDTVLQRKLNQLSRILVIAAMILIGVVALEAWLIQHMPPQAIFMTAVSMAVAAIPEGLPAVVTIALALGAQRMLRRHALIRKLPAVETLGSVTVICSDKTGTLTQNRMTVTALDMPTSAVDLAMGERKRSEMLEKFMQENSAAGLMLAAGALCSDAEIRHEDDRIRIMGDPTEGALVMAAAWAGWSKSTLEQLFPRVDERPFDAERKRMTTVHHLPGANQQIPVSLAGVVKALNRHHAGRVAFTKGAVGSLLEVADRIWVNGKTEPLTPVWRQRIEQENEKRAADGVRVLGIGWHEMSAEDEGRDPETDVVFLGMIGMLDPLREEVKDAVHTCHSAGIRPVMITGDHPLIALNIGRGLGLTEKSAVCTGVELAQLSNEQLCKSVQDTSIYARVAPEHKLRIVDALQHNGEIVAMTGDGVNDAPALKEADIGVAMGITGTDVSKGAADMILQDDNFTTIVAAVEQGRVILDNIIRFVRFILSSNWAEILVMLAAPLFGLPLPLFAVQILWMNLVTDGLPALALGVEPGDRDVMRRPPRHPDAPIIDVRTAVHILLVGACMAGFSLWLGSCFFALSGSAVAACPNAHGQVMTAPGVWQTMLFSVLVFSQLALALAERSDRSSFMKIGFFTNPHMVGAVCLTFGLQVAVIYIPFLQRIFKTQSLTIGQLGLCILFSSATWAVVEIKKWMLRLFAK
jgi:Ca2+-transporting ATPase